MPDTTEKKALSPQEIRSEVVRLVRGRAIQISKKNKRDVDNIPGKNIKYIHIPWVQCGPSNTTRKITWY